MKVYSEKKWATFGIINLGIELWHFPFWVAVIGISGYSLHFLELVFVLCYGESLIFNLVLIAVTLINLVIFIDFLLFYDFFLNMYKD